MVCSAKPTGCHPMLPYVVVGRGVRTVLREEVAFSFLSQRKELLEEQLGNPK